MMALAPLYLSKMSRKVETRAGIDDLSYVWAKVSKDAAGSMKCDR